jgi:hypothetical protein
MYSIRNLWIKYVILPVKKGPNWIKYHVEKCNQRYAVWYTSLVRGRYWLTNGMLLVLFYSMKIDLIHTSKAKRVHQGCNTFAEGRSRINIVPNSTDTNTSRLVRTVDDLNFIAPYNELFVSILYSRSTNFRCIGSTYLQICICASGVTT